MFPATLSDVRAAAVHDGSVGIVCFPALLADEPEHSTSSASRITIPCFPILTILRSSTSADCAIQNQENHTEQDP